MLKSSSTMLSVERKRNLYPSRMLTGRSRSKCTHCVSVCACVRVDGGGRVGDWMRGDYTCTEYVWLSLTLCRCLFRSGSTELLNTNISHPRMLVQIQVRGPIELFCNWIKCDIKKKTIFPFQRKSRVFPWWLVSHYPHYISIACFVQNAYSCKFSQI